MVWIPQWTDLEKLKIWLVDNVAAGVIIGVVVGVILFSFSYFCIKRWQEIRDAKKIYNWLYNETKQFSGFTVGRPEDQRWCYTEKIAEGTNLSDERVRDICNEYGKKIAKMRKNDAWISEEDNDTPLKEKWAIKEFVR
jgi:hypothetical protein